MLIPERRRRTLQDVLRSARATYRKHSCASARPPAAVGNDEPDVALGQVKLAIKGVEAQALLRVRLDNVAGILARALDTVDHTPSLVDAVRSAGLHRRSRKPLANGRS